MGAIEKFLSLLHAFQSGGISPSNRNVLVDGRFDYWTNANGVAVPGASYTNTPLWLGGNGGSSALLSAATLRGFDGEFDSTPAWSFWWQQQAASSGSLSARTLPFIQQRVEGADTLAGCSTTLSVKLWTNSTPFTIPAILCAQSFGTGGSPSGPVILDKAVNWQITQTPQRFSVKLDMPSTKGKTFGTSSDSNISMGLWLPGGKTFSLLGTEAQWEKSDPSAPDDLNGNGGNPTTYDFRGFPEEQKRCARYFAQMNVLVTAVANSYAFTLGAPMRKLPAISSTFTTGTGGVFATMSPETIYQSSAHSTAATAIITFDARL